MGDEQVIVVDTHVLIWWLAETASLSAKARRVIRDAAAENAIYLSAISILEITTLVRRNRLQFAVPVAAWLADIRLLPELHIAPVNADIAELAGGFGDEMPGDPADRIIAATAIVLGAELITADTRLQSCKTLSTVW